MSNPTTPLPTGQPWVPTLTENRAVEVDATFSLPATFVGLAFGGSPPIAVPAWIDEPGIYRFRITLEYMEPLEIDHS